ncbi:hypothetical protein SeLEV6574_g01842 [Synchytrium endobioticum]|nr:hypothetical protein SeLEV6574_g01842 [Synchytrium endobioticum]
MKEYHGNKSNSGTTATHTKKTMHSSPLSAYITARIFLYLNHACDKYNAMRVSRSWASEGMKSLYSELCLRTTRLVDITGHGSASTIQQKFVHRQLLGMQIRQDPLWLCGDRLRKLRDILVGNGTIDPSRFMSDILLVPSASLPISVPNGDSSCNNNGNGPTHTPKTGKVGSGLKISTNPSSYHHPIPRPHGHLVKKVSLIIYVPDALAHSFQVDPDMPLLAQYLGIPLSECLYVPPPTSPQPLVTANHVKNTITTTCTMDLALLAQILPMLTQIEKLCLRFVVVSPDGLQVKLNTSRSFESGMVASPHEEPTTDAMMNFVKIIQTLQPVTCRDFEAVIGGNTKNGIYPMLLLNAFSSARKRVGLYPLDYIRPTMLRDLFLSTEGVYDLELCHRVLTDGCITILAETLSDLEKLTISVDPHSLSAQTDPEVCTVVSHSLKEFLATHPNLVSVRIYGSNVLGRSTPLIDDDLAVQLSTVGSRLTTLFVPDCYFVRGSGLLRVVWTQLHHLNLEGCIYAQASFLSAIATSCPLLVTVNVSHTLCDATAFIQFMTKCVNLETIAARNCSYVGLSVLAPLVTALVVESPPSPYSLDNNWKTSLNDGTLGNNNASGTTIKPTAKYGSRLKEMDVSLSIPGSVTMLTSNLVKSLLYLARLCPDLETVMLKHIVGATMTQDTAPFFQVFKSWYVKKVDTAIREGIDVKCMRESWDSFAEVTGIVSFEKVDLTPYSAGWRMFTNWQESNAALCGPISDLKKSSVAGIKQTDFDPGSIPNWNVPEVRAGVATNTFSQMSLTQAGNISTKTSLVSNSSSSNSVDGNGNNFHINNDTLHNGRTQFVTNNSNTFILPQQPRLLPFASANGDALSSLILKPALTTRPSIPHLLGITQPSTIHPSLLHQQNPLLQHSPLRWLQQSQNQHDSTKDEAPFISISPEYAQTAKAQNYIPSPVSDKERLGAAENPPPPKGLKAAEKQEVKSSSCESTKEYLNVEVEDANKKLSDGGPAKHHDDSKYEADEGVMLAMINKQKPLNKPNRNGEYECGVDGCRKTFRNLRGVLRHRPYHQHSAYLKKSSKADKSFSDVKQKRSSKSNRHSSSTSSALSEPGDSS